MWEALGDVPHYVEPFFGSGAVLMRRPHIANRSYHSETVNDLDGLLVNAWRSIQMSPEATAEAASWPVSEADLHARHLALVRWRSERQLEHLMADPAWHDPVMAGWWMWGQSCWIGRGWCSGKGGWHVGADGRITKQARRTKADTAREEGVDRQLPHLSGNGQGVNHAGTREDGVDRQLPHLGDDGKGVNHAGTREEGVARQLPNLGNNGRGVNHAGCREEGIGPEPDYHPMTMPELRRWMRFLAARLRHVRILNGDWKRALTTGAAHTLPVRQGNGPCGVFLDPPYADTAERVSNLYSHDDEQVAHAVREWALVAGEDPKFRIVLAGFDGEHGDMLARGWREVEWFKTGFLKGGMANIGDGGHDQVKERLWLSPHCLGVVPVAQQSLFGVRA